MSSNGGKRIVQVYEPPITGILWKAKNLCSLLQSYWTTYRTDLSPFSLSFLRCFHAISVCYNAREGEEEERMLCCPGKRCSINGIVSAQIQIQDSKLTLNFWKLSFRFSSPFHYSKGTHPLVFDSFYFSSFYTFIIISNYCQSWVYL